MTQISLSQLKLNPGKYVNMAGKQDIMITRNGKIVAKLVSAKPDKRTAWNQITDVFKKAGINLTDDEIDMEREERILG